MANKLKNIQLTSVDLVRAGANQEADICLFKSAAPPEKSEKPELSKPPKLSKLPEQDDDETDDIDEIDEVWVEEIEDVS